MRANQSFAKEGYQLKIACIPLNTFITIFSDFNKIGEMYFYCPYKKGFKSRSFLTWSWV